MNTQDYSRNYTEASLRSKLGSFAVSAGKEVVEKVLVLFEAFKDADTPAWAKAVIVAALGYFIAPVDAIPDIVPLAGFADDLGALAVALGTVAAHVKKEHMATASRTMSRWFKTVPSESRSEIVKSKNRSIEEPSTQPPQD